MAHDLYLKREISEGENPNPEDFAIYLYKEPAWHGLGTVSPIPLPRHMVAEVAAMDFEAKKLPLHVKVDDLDIEVPEKFAVVRGDNNKVIGTVGPDYKIVQWSEIFDFAETIGSVMPDELIYESAGLLGDRGARGFVQIQLGESFKFGADEIVPYLFLFNSMDGSKAITISTCTTRIVCSNTLQMAMDEKGHTAQWVLRHSSLVGNRIEMAKASVTQAGIAWGVMREDIKRMSDTKAPENFLPLLIKNVFGELPKDAEGGIVTRRKNIEAKIFELYAGETCKGTSGDSIWSALNAVTEYLQYHSTVHGDGLAAQFARFESDMMGSIAKQKASALQFALSHL